MIQCSECEYFRREPSGNAQFACDPFSTIKEPECLAKWQLIKLNTMTAKLENMVQAYQATVEIYKRLAPMQEKMFRHMEREIDEIDEADKWKQGYDEDEDEDDQDPDAYRPY